MKKTICICIILIFVELFIAYSGFTGNQALFSGLGIDESNFIINATIVGGLLIIINIVVSKKDKMIITNTQKKIVIILFIVLLIVKILLIFVNNVKLNKYKDIIENINSSITNVSSFSELIEVAEITEEERNILIEKGSLSDNYSEKLRKTSLILGYNVYYAATMDVNTIRDAVVDGIWANYKYNNVKYSEYKKRVRQ